MKKIIAIPFDQYQSSKTERGIIYNLAEYDRENNNLKVHCQCWVANKPFTNHDLCIDSINQAPTNTREAVSSLFDRLFGKEQWKVVTRFSIKNTRQSVALRNFEFTSHCQSFGYDDKRKELIVKKPMVFSQNL